MLSAKSNLKLLIARIFFVIALSICIVPAASGQEVSTIIIDILTVNDFHGNLLEDSKNPGAAKLAGFLKTEKSRNPDGTLILSAGDMFQGTAESNILYGQPVLDVMREIGFDAMAIGNHEFDWGIEVLNSLSKKANFPFLSANIIDKDSLEPASFAKPYIIIEKKGIKIGIIGLTTLETAYKTKPSIVSNLIFTDLSTTVNSLVPTLKKEGAQIIIVLGHIDSEMTGQIPNISGEAADLAGKIKGVDAIVSAHSHYEVAGKVNEIPIIQAGCWGQAVGKISLIYSKKDEKVIDSIPEVISLKGTEIDTDANVKDIVSESGKTVESIKNEKLGTTAQELSHTKFEFSVLGQLVSDVMRKKVKADIAFQNGGGLRSGIDKGTITVGSIYKVVPFDNNLVTMNMTGRQIMKVLEHGIFNKNIGMLQYSGLNVVYDDSVPDGKGIVSVTTLNGKKLDLNKTYKVVTIDFLADGGDGFDIFKEGENINDTYILERDMLIEFVKSVKSIKFKGDGRFKLAKAKAA